MYFKGGLTMIEAKGNFTTAKIFTNNIEETALEQIIELCSQEFTKTVKFVSCLMFIRVKGVQLVQL